MDNSIKRRFHPLALILAISFILACDLPIAVPAAVPTIEPLDTVIARTANAASAQTAIAASTQTGEAASPTATTGVSHTIPTATSTPTYISGTTPSAAPSITPTFIFILSTLTPTNRPSDNYACQITGQTPENGTVIVSGLDFQASWVITNTGSATWDSNSIDFIYAGGEKLTKSKALDFPSSVAPTVSITIGLVMTAPSAPGPHKTVWALRVGKNEFCDLPISIVVK